MIKERYVNFEVARLLRDKGFYGDCLSMYLTPKHHYGMGNPNEAILAPHGRDSHYYEGYIYQCEAPTQQMACDWVEETFNITIVLDLTILGYEPGFLNGHKNPNTASTAFLAEKDYIPVPIGDNSDGSWSSKELVYNEALKYVLTNLV